MAGNRKGATNDIVSMIAQIIEGDDTNAKYWKERLDAMSDVEFDRFMGNLKDRKERLAFVAPNISSKKLSIKRNLDLGKKWGVEFFHKLWIDNGIDPPYLTNQKYLVFDWTLRLQAQLQTKKMAVPEDNKSIDDLTGQPTGRSKSSKISYPELQVLAAHGLDKTTAELVKFRGGDTDGYNALTASISRTGYASLETLDTLNTKVRSTETFSAYLTGMHFGNTLLH